MKKSFVTLKRFVSLFKRRLPAYVFSSAVVSGRNFLLTWLTAYIGSRVILAVEAGSLNGLGNELLRFSFLLLVYAITDTAGMFLFSVTTQNIENDIRFGAVSGVWRTTFSKSQSLGGRGEVLSRINKDAVGAVGLLSGGVVTVAMCAISGIGATAVIARESVFICLCLYLLGAAGFLVQKLITKKIKALSVKQRKASSSAMSVYLQILSRSSDVKMSGSSRYALKRYETELSEFRRISDKLAVYSGISDGVTEGIGLIGFWGTVGLCIYTHATKGSSLNSAVMLSQMSSLVLMMAMSLYSFMQNLRGSLVGVERVLELSSLPSEDVSGEELDLGGRDTSLVKADKALCTFENGNSILYDLEIPKNKLVAIVGESGRGKTTLLRLVLKLIPCSGSLSLGNSSINACSAAEVRENLSYVPQDNPVLGGTVREILTFGNEKALSDSVLWKSLELIGAEDWVSSLDLEIADGGANLSGGQKQMLAIARAILFEREILVLDEAFSGMDEEHISVIMPRLKALCGSRSVLIVTHDKRIRDMCDVCVEV